MRLLLDTHILLWAAAEPHRLKPAAIELMDESDEIFVSAVSIWEVAIKYRLGKIAVHPERIAAFALDNGFRDLPVTSSHAVGVTRLDMHHGDPFDRLLIAQAKAEPLCLLTADSTLTRYGDFVVLV